MNKNDYSKFKYDNSFKLKFSVNPYDQKTSILNTGLRTIKPVFENKVVDFNIGQTVVTDYVYQGTQVNWVDEPVIAKSPIKNILFKLFKLS